MVAKEQQDRMESDARPGRANALTLGPSAEPCHVAAWAAGREHKHGKRVIDRPAPKRATRDVYVYFDNDKKVRAPFDAHSLIIKVKRRLKA